jgi:hypothetical protein
MLLKALLGLVA